MKKFITIFFLLTALSFAQNLTVSAPTRLDLTQYYTDKFSLNISVIDDSGDGFNFSGYTGVFNIKKDETSTLNLKSFAVSFSDSIITIEIPADSLTSLRAPRLLEYQLILNNGSSNKAWLAGTFNYTIRPVVSQINTATIQFNTETLSLTAGSAGSGTSIDTTSYYNKLMVNALLAYKLPTTTFTDSINAIRLYIQSNRDSLGSHNARLLALLDSLNNIYTKSQVDGLLLPSISSLSATATLTNDNEVILFTTGVVSDTITLPTTSINDGKIFNIKKVDSGAGTVVIKVEGTGTIDGAATLTIFYQYTSYNFIKSGNNYFIL